MFTLPKLVPKISRKKRSIGKKWKQQLASLDAFPQLLTTHRSVTSKISEATFFQEEMGNGTLMSHLCLFYMQVSVINKHNKQMEHIKPNTPTCIFKWGSHQHKIIYKLKIILKSPVQPVPCIVNNNIISIQSLSWSCKAFTKHSMRDTAIHSLLMAPSFSCHL